jgi:uncharacterized protein
MTAIQRPGVFVNQNLTPLATSTTGIPGEGEAAFAAAYNIGPVLPVEVTSFNAFTNLFGTFAQSSGSLLHHAVYQYFANGGPACFVCRVPNTDATSATLGLLDTNSPADTVMTVTASSPGAWGNSVYVEITAAGISGRFNLNVYNGNTVNPVEQYVSASINPADSRYIATMVNSPVSGSNYITLTVSLPSNTYVAGVNDPAPISPTALASGADGSTAPNLGTTVPAAYDTLQDQVLYLNLPGVTNTTYLNAILSWADSRGDVMLVVDGPAPNPPETSSQVATNYIDMVSGGSQITSDANATVYAPWLLVLDPSSTVPGATRYVPPGGAVLAMWNQAATQFGIQRAPAGTWAQLGVIALETNFTATDLDNLTTYQVNPIKLVPGAGFCVFGTRTLSQGYPNRYVNVQRTLIQLTHDMENILSAFVFDDNDSTLWAAITATLTGYLTQQMQLGVLAGSTPDTAFSVVCDTSNNTPTTAQTGLVNVTVGVALLSPAEFIVIDLQQLAGTAPTGS